MSPIWLLAACEDPEPEIVDEAYLDIWTTETDIDVDTDADSDADADADTDSAIETGTPPTEGDPTNAAAYTGPPRVMYGTGSFFFGEVVVLDLADRSEVYRAETQGTTLVGCSGGSLAALVSSFLESELRVVDPDGGPVFQETWPTLTFPSVFTERDGDFVMGDEGRPSLGVYDAAGTSVGTIGLQPIADGDGMAEPRWMIVDADGALWVGVDRYNQLIGGAGSGPNDGAAIAVVEPGADRATDVWALGTPLGMSPQIVAHDGKLWLGSLGGVTPEDQLAFDGGLVTFDLASRAFGRVVEGTAMSHVVERADGDGMWVFELMPGGGRQIVAVDWDGTRGTTVSVSESPTGIGEDDDGNLWIADVNGLRVVDPATGDAVAPIASGEVGSLRICR